MAAPQSYCAGACAAMNYYLYWIAFGFFSPKISGKVRSILGFGIVFELVGKKVRSGNSKFDDQNHMETNFDGQFSLERWESPNESGVHSDQRRILSKTPSAPKLRKSIFIFFWIPDVY